MSKGDTLENKLLLMIFNANPIANLCDNAASSPLTVLWVALHTADPGEAGAQNTSEATYGGYLRTSVSRATNGSGWTVTTNSASPTAAVTFPACTAGSNTVTHFSVGSASSGAGILYYSGTVTPNLSVSSGVTPQLTTGSTITED